MEQPGRRTGTPDEIMNLKRAGTDAREIPPETGCLVTTPVPAVCLRLNSRRERIAIPYAMLLRVEISDGEKLCDLTFATHIIHVRGENIDEVFVAVSQAKAVELRIRSDVFAAGEFYRGPLITQISIEPLDESLRTKR
jgi:hypothetical protein